MSTAAEIGVLTTETQAIFNSERGSEIQTLGIGIGNGDEKG